MNICFPMFFGFYSMVCVSKILGIQLLVISKLKKIIVEICGV